MGKLAAALGPHMFDNDCSGYELGFDELEPHNSCVYSMGIGAIRCSDLPDDMKNKAAFSHVLFIIPGPKAPSVIRPFVLRTLRAFRYAPCNVLSTARMRSRM